jgi:hypothetical protein
MAMRLILPTASTLLSLTACAAGSGPFTTFVAQGREAPTATREAPPSSRDNPGSACIVCDVSYECSGPLFGSQGTQFELNTTAGMCTQALIDFFCSGALFGATSCTGGGGGPFLCGDTSCSPGGSPPMSVVTVGGSPASGPVDAGASGSSSSGGMFLL